MNQTSTIHSMNTGLIYAVLKLSFSKQYKICVLILSMVNSMKTSFTHQQSIVSTHSVNHMK